MVNEKGGAAGPGAGVEDGLGAVAGAGAARWSIDVGAESTEVAKDEQHEEPESSQVAAAEVSPGKGKVKALPDGVSPVRDAGDASLAEEASPAVLPEALPE